MAGWRAKLPERLRDRFQIRLAYITIASLVYSLYVFVFELLLYGINAFFVTTHEHVAQWALRNLLDGAARFTYLFIAGLLFYSLISLFDRYWLRLAAVIIPLLLFLALHVTPDFKQLFNQITPLKDKSKEALILKFAEECGIEADIKQVDASRQSGLINARSTGSLSKRPDKSHVTIIYWDTLLDTFTEVEILFATAHEFGHHALVVNDDAKVMRKIVIVCLVIVGFFITGRGCKFLIRRYHARMRFDEMNDPASIPLVALIVSLLLFIYIPIDNAMTLYQERYADWSAARLVVKDDSSREAAINAFEKLGAASLYDPHPPLIFKLFLEDHPTIDERQQFIKSFDVERSGNQPPRHSFLQALYRLL